MPTLTVLNHKQAGHKLVLDESDFVVGRSENCDIRLSSGKISRQHCVFRCRSIGLFLEDLGSSNGTWVNEQQITGKKELHTGDVVRIGSWQLQVSTQANPVPESGGDEQSEPEDGMVVGWLTDEEDVAPESETVVASSVDDLSDDGSPDEETLSEDGNGEAESTSDAAASSGTSEPQQAKRAYSSIAAEGADIIRRHLEQAGAKQPQAVAGE